MSPTTQRMTLALVLVLCVLPFITAQGPSCPSNPTVRTDCGFTGITQQGCQNRGCCWQPVNPNPSNQPWCFSPPPDAYSVDGGSLSSAPYGLSGTVSVKSNGRGVFGPDIPTLSVQAIEETNTRLRVRITDNANARWEVPNSILPRPPIPSSRASSPEYKFAYTANPFGFSVTRNSDNAVMFNSTPGSFNPLVFEDQYLEISTSLQPQARLFGLGEQTQSGGFALNPGTTFTMWNRDQPAATTNQNLYGTHPFFMSVSSDGSAFGVVLINSNGMDIDYPDNGASLTYRVLGGVLDFYFFVGPTPDLVVQQYTDLIGKPHLPALWTLGFHNCRYGYPNVQTLQEVVANYSAAGIPLDTMWTDIDYMNKYNDFTFDPTNYPVAQMNTFVDGLHKDGQQYVVIVDPGIPSQPVQSPYAPLSDGLSAGIFIKDAQGNPFEGSVWPGLTYFPDFFNPATQEYWDKTVSDFRQLVPVDGLWIDMNEISNFCTGECHTPTPPLNYDTVKYGKHPPKTATASASDVDHPTAVSVHAKRFRGRQRVRVSSDSTLTTVQERVASLASGPNYQDPPFRINNCGSQCPLNTKTLDMTAQHYPYNSTMTLEYNTHNLFGLTEGIATRKALEKDTGKRAFVVTRSTYISSGHHVSHWTGDNTSSWSDLMYSIWQIMNFNLYGVTQIGADICGFLGSTTEELCTRWIQVGAFYTFSRDHNTKGSPSQELYRWPSVSAAAKSVLSTRYQLLSYFYTLMAESSSSGSAVLRPLWYNYPSDPTSLTIDQQFMVGPGLLISPVLTQGATSVSAYFPKGFRFFDFYTYNEVQHSGSPITLQAPLNVINVHIAGGQILSKQNYTAPQTIPAFVNNPYTFIVAPDSSNSASGSLYLDDGESLQPTSSTVTLSYNAGKLSASVSGSWSTSRQLGGVDFLGVASQPSQVLFNGAAVPSSQVSYNSASQSLSVTGLNFAITSGWTLSYA
eukprot:TRINITY_DN5799_c0_g1_i1.p1 TRINITY_DN5799_c0_g1~~TRINITY_DN5799_c0_g1_i1.p1  ORF type:complete len:964 (-),score=240.45 TRINITY_DN5799_c0_g1_i1:111-3002(-)